MDKKIVIITGANSGIGRAAALKFAMAKHIVIMACRNIEKSKPVYENIVSLSNNNNVFLEKLDISSQKSIFLFCETIKRKFDTVDILINNAAYFNHGESYRLSEDNIEITFATNVVGPFLITKLLLCQLKKSDNPKILNASSNIIKHYFSPKKRLCLENLTGVTNKKYKHSVYHSYRNSKLAFLMLSFKLSEILAEYGINVNSLQISGAKMSKDTLRKFKFGWRMIAHIQNIFFPTPEIIAENYVELCLTKKFENVTGKIFNTKLEVMKAGEADIKFKDIWSDSFYPSYADKKDLGEKILGLCSKLTESYIQ